MNPASPDYYRILEVGEYARPEEIRRSYRRLAKKYHPDLHPGRQDWAQDQFKALGEAYHVLIDPVSREAYDRQARLGGRRAPREERSWEDPLERSARAVLQELLHQRGDQAISLYEQLVKDTGLEDPLARLGVRDYLDCKFLLAEAYERRGDLACALRFYEEVYEEERDEPRLRCYFEEVVDRMRTIYLTQLSRARTREDALRVHLKAMAMETAPRSLADLHKRMAQTLLTIGWADEALRFLEQAFRMNPNLKGAQRICRQLQFTPGETP